MLEKLLSGDISLRVCTADESDKGAKLEVGRVKQQLQKEKMNLNIQEMSHSVGHYRMRNDGSLKL